MAEGEERLIAAIFEQAFHKMRKGDVAATVFLITKAAGDWLDWLDIDHEWALRKADWPQYAKACLEREIRLEDRGLLEAGLAYFGA